MIRAGSRKFYSVRNIQKTHKSGPGYDVDQ